MKIKFHYSILFLIILAFLSGFIYKLLALLIIISLHELGHLFFLLRYNRKVEEILFLPFGAIIGYRDDLNVSLTEEFLISFGGIFVNIIILIIFRLLNVSSHNIFYIFNLYVLFFNLLPIFPLDGGRILEVLFCRFFKFKKVLNLKNYLSLLVIFFINLMGLFFYRNLNLFFITSYLLIQNINDLKSKNRRYYLFLLNKFLTPNNELSEKEIKIINGKLSDNLFRGFNNFILGKKKITEEVILNKYFNKNIN